MNVKVVYNKTSTTIPTNPIATETKTNRLLNTYIRKNKIVKVETMVERNKIELSES